MASTSTPTTGVGAAFVDTALTVGEAVTDEKGVGFGLQFGASELLAQDELGLYPPLAASLEQGVEVDLTGFVGRVGKGGFVQFDGCGPPQLQISSPEEESAHVLGVALPLPAGFGGSGNLDPPPGYTVPFDEHAASPASVDDW